MSSPFELAWKFTKKWEGGYVNDPNDPGGETKYGISKRAHPKEDIKNLTEERAKEIYYNDYWFSTGCSSLDGPTSVAAFDTAVNCGVSRTREWLGNSETVEDLLRHRAVHYYRIAQINKKLRKFVNGWFNRLFDLHDFISKLKEETT